MGKDALSFEEVAVLLGESPGPAGPHSEADDLRRRLAGAHETPDLGSLAASPASTGSARLLDHWPWPPRLAARMAESWSDLLRTEVRVAVLHVEATTFGGFLLRAQLPTFLATATRPGGTPLLAVEIPLPLACSALHRMLGGPLEDPAEPDPGLTPLERRLATRLITCLVAESLTITGEPSPRPTLPLAGGSDAVAAGEGGESPPSAPFDTVPLVVHDRLPHVTPTWSRTPAASIQFRVTYGPVIGLLHACVPWAT